MGRIGMRLDGRGRHVLQREEWMCASFKKKKVIQRSGRSLCFFVCREGVWTNDRKKDSRTYVAAERSKVCGRERMHPIV